MKKGDYRMRDQTKIQKYCSRCVLFDTYRRIRFDEMGVCNYCREHEKYVLTTHTI